MVTSYKINENKIYNRGSKSKLIKKFVKEQRVGNNWGFLPFKGNSFASITILNYKSLRCNLMGCERSYQVNLLSKQLDRLFYSTISGKNTILNPFLCQD